MSIVDVEFAFFLPVLLLIYWGLARGARGRNAVLLAAGYAFYASWHWPLLGLVIAGTLIDLACARVLVADTTALRRRLALTMSLAFSLGALAFFKYGDFFIGQFVALARSLGLSPSFQTLGLILPLGISYYTLQRVGYMLDLYWRRREPATHWLDFAVFACFFPQLGAGPIARGHELLPQLAGERRLSPQLVADAAFTYLLGLTMQAWAGAAIGEALVDPVFAAPAEYNALAHWGAVIGFALQVFADFAGYSLMAIGVGLAFGIRLPINFDRPFLSTSLPEFWRRWHITLNRWLFDYIFTPLITSTGWFRGRMAFALMLTFLASGLWHGANWTFIVWGALHGLGMIVHLRWDERYKQWCRRDRRFVAWRRSLPYRLLAWALTITFFVLCLVPFRSPSIDGAVAFSIALFSADGVAGPQLSPSMLLAIGFLIAHHLLGLPVLRVVTQTFFALPAPLRGVAYGLLIAFLFVSMPIGPGTFIYQQF
ncbi:MAG: MBOAT family O-acyltransferase [Burkholderiaceae bacterium]